MRGIVRCAVVDIERYVVEAARANSQPLGKVDGGVGRTALADSKSSSVSIEQILDNCAASTTFAERQI
jgi:hypothetical protein